MILVFDSETDGFLPPDGDVSTIHIIIAAELDDKLREVKRHVFNSQAPRPFSIEDGLELLSTATTLVGHNIQEYDNRVFNYLKGWKPSSFTKISDRAPASRCRQRRSQPALYLCVRPNTGASLRRKGCPVVSLGSR